MSEKQQEPVAWKWECVVCCSSGLWGYKIAPSSCVGCLADLRPEKVLPLYLHPAPERDQSAGIAALIKAAEHYLWKVETGRARSVESYNMFKAALRMLNAEEE
jgi:hypothetical protein